ncbi:hypothetical protein [Haladaptatus halobius]|uniref:hypothetical protein n=1 Tax=Haladaptatus halobius TaxID=2884875 RepID=UPI001D0BB16D|nr:hypothetical protein [Haladaptatus halobius]
MSETESKQTTDHDEIRNWVEENDGQSAKVEGTGDGGGLLRIEFPDAGNDESLEEISWDEFFETFEENDLALVYQEETEGGGESRFSKLVSREE